MTKTEKLKEAYEILKQGKFVQFVPDKGSTKNGVVCWIRFSEHDRKRYIFFRSFGQSAIGLGISNLRWIVKVIGECTTYEYKVVDSIFGGKHEQDKENSHEKRRHFRKRSGRDG